MQRVTIVTSYPFLCFELWVVLSGPTLNSVPFFCCSQHHVWSAHCNVSPLLCWSRHVSLSGFRGTSCFVAINVIRAVLGDSAQPYTFGCSVVTASRCEVATHAAAFCSLVEKTHELANPWRRFECLVMF